jgi:hypothetical protein
MRVPETSHHTSKNTPQPLMVRAKGCVCGVLTRLAGDASWSAHPSVIGKVKLMLKDRTSRQPGRRPRQGIGPRRNPSPHSSHSFEAHFADSAGLGPQRLTCERARYFGITSEVSDAQVVVGTVEERRETITA